ncbi:MAG: site-specific integrase [Lentimicrobiaceae bacterium]|nr:site-specific integrase [Lentimicrobiaceae bacterium]
MARVRFNIEKRRDENGKLIIKDVPICFTFTWEGMRLKRPTGHRCDAKYWNTEKQRVRAGAIGYLIINKFLDDLEQEVRKIYWDARSENIWPSKEYMKQRISIYSKRPKGFFEIYDYFIKSHLKLNSEATRKKHKSLYKHLQEFENKKRYSITFDSLDKNFYSRFVDYLLFDRQMINATVIKYTGILHWFLAWADEQGYIHKARRDYRTFKAPGIREEQAKKPTTNKVILSMEEVLNIYNADLPEHLDKVRDGFCLMCFTGLRFSDLQNLKKTDIKDDCIEITTIKTRQDLKIPLNNYSRAILDRYKDYPKPEVLPVITNQKFNQALKTIGKIAGMNDPVTLISYRGSQRIETIKARHDLLSCHAARRSFVAIAIALGIRTEVIMDITGHRTHKIMEEYYAIFQEHKEKEMQKFN